MVGAACDVSPEVTDRPHIRLTLHQRRRAIDCAGDYRRRAWSPCGEHEPSLDKPPREIDFCSIKLSSVIIAKRLLKFALMLRHCTFGLHQTRNCVHLTTPFTFENVSGSPSRRPIASICNLGSQAAVTAVATSRHFDTLSGFAATSSTVRYEITRSASPR